MVGHRTLPPTFVTNTFKAHFSLTVAHESADLRRALCSPSFARCVCPPVPTPPAPRACSARHPPIPTAQPLLCCVECTGEHTAVSLRSKRVCAMSRSPVLGAVGSAAMDFGGLSIMGTHKEANTRAAAPAARAPTRGRNATRRRRSSASSGASRSPPALSPATATTTQRRRRRSSGSSAAAAAPTRAYPAPVACLPRLYCCAGPALTCALLVCWACSCVRVCDSVCVCVALWCSRQERTQAPGGASREACQGVEANQPRRPSEATAGGDAARG